MFGPLLVINITLPQRQSHLFLLLIFLLFLFLVLLVLLFLT